MNAANERPIAVPDGSRLELPCGHEVVLPAGLSAPGMAYSVLGHQMTCTNSGPDPTSLLPPPPELSDRRRRERRVEPHYSPLAHRPPIRSGVR